MSLPKLHPLHIALMLGAAVLLACTPLMVTRAQEQPPAGSGQALEISPAIANLEVDPGEVTEIELRLRNISNEALIVSGEINDFVAFDETGAPKILTEQEDIEALGDNPFSFKDWVNPLPQLLLEPNEIETINATINVPADASPGGHYGVVRFSGTPPELEDAGVSLAASVGALMLITVSGDITESIEIEEFMIAKDGVNSPVFESTPLEIIQRIRNTGNVHVQATGRVNIKDMFDRDVAAANVNLSRQNILPESIRRFEQDIDSSLIGNKRLFGRYSATLELTYGADKMASATTTFWVIPYRLIGVIVLLLVVIALGIHYSLKRYKQRIIRQTRAARR